MPPGWLTAPGRHHLSVDTSRMLNRILIKIERALIFLSSGSLLRFILTVLGLALLMLVGVVAFSYLVHWINPAWQ